MTTYDLENTYLGLSGDGEVTQMRGGADFWRTIETNPLMRPTLVTLGGGEGDWTSWEMHPQGEEVLVLLEGAATMILETDSGEERHALTPGTTLVVPRGTWHRAEKQSEVKMLFITYGAGTQHKPVAA